MTSNDRSAPAATAWASDPASTTPQSSTPSPSSASAAVRRSPPPVGGTAEPGWTRNRFLVTGVAPSVNDGAAGGGADSQSLTPGPHGSGTPSALAASPAKSTSTVGTRDERARRTA